MEDFVDGRAGLTDRFPSPENMNVVSRLGHNQSPSPLPSPLQIPMQYSPQLPLPSVQSRDEVQARVHPVPWVFFDSENSDTNSITSLPESLANISMTTLFAFCSNGACPPFNNTQRSEIPSARLVAVASDVTKEWRDCRDLSSPMYLLPVSFARSFASGRLG